VCHDIKEKEVVVVVDREREFVIDLSEFTLLLGWDGINGNGK